KKHKRRKTDFVLFVAIVFPSTVGIILHVATNRNITPAKTELPQFVLQRLPVHVENLCRTRHITLRVLEAARDVTALKLPAIFSKIGCKRKPQTVCFGFAF